MPNPFYLRPERGLGTGYPVYIIAEMSANHGGSIERALEILRAAKTAGADCIKLQTYTADTLTIDSDQEPFQIKSGNWAGETLYQLYDRAYTPWEWHRALFEEAKALGLDFLSTPFDTTAVDFLEELGVEAYKIASFEAVDLKLIRYIAAKGKPIFLSTGMASFEEISEAVEAIRSEGNHQICLLRCSSAYPALAEDMNLRIIPYFNQVFDLPAGLSDHSQGSLAAIAAAAVGACVIEKHFCISRKDQTADASFSMEPEEFAQMVEAVRQTERALGRVDFSISELEKGSLIFRRSLFAVEDIQAGEAFTERNIRSIRPGHGLKPKHYDSVLGKLADSFIARGTPLTWDLIRMGD